MASERAACFRHLHQAQHSFVHARAAGSRDDDDRAAFGGPVFDRARDSFADDRSHRGGEKSRNPSPRSRPCNRQSFRAADDRINQSRGVLIFFEAIFVRGHSLETQACPPISESASISTKRSGIQQVFDSLLGRLGKMIIATRTDPLILRQLDFVDDLSAAGTFLKKPLRNLLASFRRLRLDRRFFENRHDFMRAPQWPREQKLRRAFQEHARTHSA